MVLSMEYFLGYATWKHKYDLLNPLINNYEQLKENGI
jgi:hypothetical protein